VQHEIIIPGLDRQLCGKCGKWICRPGELERLKKQMATASAKRLPELQREYKEEEILAERCPGKRINQK
jgi:hypothetical protein